MEKYYLVDELDNDGMCFSSIQEIKEQAEWFGLNFEELTIYETEMMPLQIYAENVIDMALEGKDFHEDFSFESIPKQQVQELQDFLNTWCEKIDTNSYVRSRKLSIEELNERWKLEKRK